MQNAMRRFTDLRTLFTVVAGLEIAYAAIAMVPPSWITPLTGWVLNADGQWVTKLLGMALASQAWVAWMFRDRPHLGIAKMLAVYQIGSATVDWVLWISLADEGIFSTTQAQVGTALAVLSHYVIGLLLLAGVRASTKAVGA